MLKKCKVVMLPTKDQKAAAIWKSKASGRLFTDTISAAKGTLYSGNHLYILSDDEIKEGDWVIDNRKGCDNFIHQISCKVKGGVKKIIATTDQLEVDRRERLSILPSPSQSFIERYCEKGGIDKVMVEYQENVSGGWIPSYNDPDNSGLAEPAEPDGTFSLKVSEKDNTITIRSVKTSWNREEVIGLIEKACDANIKRRRSIHEKILWKEWIEENL